MSTNGAVAQNISQANFLVEMSQDGLLAFIPKGSVIPSEVTFWNIQDLKVYLKNLGFIEVVLESDFSDFMKTVKSNPKGVPKDLILVRGTPPVPAVPGRLDFLNPPSMPRDQVTKDSFFLKITEPKAAINGRNVKGAPISLATKDKIQPMLKKIPPEFTRHPDGRLQATASGQASVKGDELAFSPQYTVENAATILKAEFFSNVIVKSDLVQSVQWVVHGDLTVEGYWSAGNVTVDGNVIANSGVQTNNLGVVKIGGNFKTTYLQRTTLEVGGNIEVETGALLSSIQCRGSFKCKGSPGAIMGSKVECFGHLEANKVGSDRGTFTEITIHKNELGQKSKIELLTQGTKMNVHGKKFVQTNDVPFESE